MNAPLIHLATVDSTQAFLRRHPELGFCAVLADRQTAGRGRQGNRWESAPGAGLWFSAAVPPRPGLPPGLVMQRAMAVVARVLDPEGRTLGLKWPNDLVAWQDGRLRKLGGILGEQIGGRLLLGVGVNLVSAPDLPDRAIPAGCLKDLGLEAPPVEDIALALFSGWKDGEEHVSWPFRWPAEGDSLHWEEGRGTCLEWEPDGRLKVATAAGVERLSAGDLRGLATER
ncbi:MAG TPA: biotin--[acetyl-CoA-carboxylase] ligase [Holophagaceae bacterium]